MDTMNKAAAKSIRQRAEKALRDEFSDELEVSFGNGTFDPSVGTFGVKVTFGLAGAEQAEFARNAPLFGLSAEDFGREFTSRGKKFKVVGIKPRSRKYPVIAEDEAGKQYKFVARAVNPAATPFV